jgi:putative transposase
LLAERGVEIACEMIGLWMFKIGSRMLVTYINCARDRQAPGILDEMVIRVQGQRLYLGWADEHESDIIDMLAQSRRDKGAALRLMRKLLKKQGFAPRVLVTDKVCS